jgi:hypothetical protein
MIYEMNIYSLIEKRMFVFRLIWRFGMPCLKNQTYRRVANKAKKRS